YQADVSSFLPWLVGVYDKDTLSAAAGFRFASDTPLYLEHYLDQPIEEALSHLPGLHARREQITEIGNLAGTRHDAVQQLFVILACLMQASGVTVTACTANPAVRALFREMKLPFKPLCTAAASRLGTSATQWGDYYRRTCVVMAANIGEVIDSLSMHDPDTVSRYMPIAEHLVHQEHLLDHERTAH
ncbi:MAG: hypothetical protein EP312_01135, partial [Gammaproteobacteria bacterium]